MSIRNDIAKWAAGRPAWQQAALAKLALGDTFDASDYESLASELLHGQDRVVKKYSLPKDWAFPETNHPVTVSEVHIGENVNRLEPGQRLTFEPSGLTVVYGDNGSGKSGYARLLKHFCGARVITEVLPNVFERPSDSPPSAEIAIRVNGEPQDSMSWAHQPSIAHHVSYFDKDCGNDFLGRDTEVTYRPRELQLLTDLITICDGVRDELRSRQESTVALPTHLPKVSAGGAAERFLQSLSSKTTNAEVEAATVLEGDHEIKLQELLREEARLLGEKPAVVRQQLLNASTDLATLADHLSYVTASIGPMALRNATATGNDAERLRGAATAASAEQFATDPLPGIGSDTWRALWQAAREYSVAEAYPSHTFPHVGDEAKCVLCQQDLLPVARDRLSRFESFIRDRTEQQAVEAEAFASDARNAIMSFTLVPEPIAGALGRLESEHRTTVGRYRRLLRGFAHARDMWIQNPSADVNVPRPTGGIASQLRKMAAARGQAASEIDDQGVAERLRETIDSRRTLEDRIALNDGKNAISKEIKRQQLLTNIERTLSAVSTRQITTFVSSLTRRHVSSEIRERFNEEVKALRLRSVTLEDRGGQKGQLMQRPRLVEAVQSARLEKVLSEGEQTALGLAGFFTESHFDKSRSSLILDDPVSSLDHMRRKQVAAKLSSLSVDRQIIVFTHDLAFVAYLRKASKDIGAPFAERSIVSTPLRRIGICRDHHPWNALSARKRLNQLKQDLVKIQKHQEEWEEDAYNSAASTWAGRLSEALERAIGIETAGRVLEPSTLETRPLMFRVFARITEDDNSELQEMYSAVSTWTTRHDDSPLSNVPPLTVEQMEDLLQKAEIWLKRVTKYASTP